MVITQDRLEVFCSRNAVDVAQDLIGWDLQVNGAGGRIVETEAYTRDDPASHSYSGPRKTNRSMWLSPGSCYVYRIYGLHHCINVVCADAGAVLIRALEPLHDIPAMQARRGGVGLKTIANGPGKLCQALGIDLRYDGCSFSAPPFELLPFDGLGMAAGKHPVLAGPRIGISRNVDAAWRFRATGSSGHSR